MTISTPTMTYHDIDSVVGGHLVQIRFPIADGTCSFVHSFGKTSIDDPSSYPQSSRSQHRRHFHPAGCGFIDDIRAHFSVSSRFVVPARGLSSLWVYLPLEDVLTRLRSVRMSDASFAAVSAFAAALTAEGGGGWRNGHSGRSCRGLASGLGFVGTTGFSCSMTSRTLSPARPFGPRRPLPISDSGDGTPLARARCRRRSSAPARTRERRRAAALIIEGHH